MTPKIRILIIRGVGISDGNAEQQAVAQSAVSPETEVVVRNLEGVPPTSYLSSEDILLSPLLKTIRAAEAEGFHAVGISCCGDPGLREAKALVSIPVTGPFESAVRTGLGFGPFSILYLNVPSGPNENLPQNANWIRALTRDYGCADMLISAMPINVQRPDQEMNEGASADVAMNVQVNMGNALSLQAPALVAQAYEAGARSVFVACTKWAGGLDVLRDVAPITILDPVKVLAGYCELLARARLRDLG